MNMISRIVYLTCLSSLLLASTAAADIRIISGSLVFASGEGVIDTRGTDGFTFFGGGSLSGGIMNPANQCGVPECPPGTVIGLDAFWSGSDLGGLAKLRGVDWEVGLGDFPGQAAAIVEFSGSLTAPAFNSAGTVEVSAPFTFSGRFTYVIDNDQIVTELLTGHGVATLSLEMNQEGTSWEFRSARYQFEARPAH